MRVTNEVHQNDVVSLSTTKIINQRAFANTLGIPMGAVVHLLPSHSENGIPQLHREPLFCRKCGACINRFCTVTRNGHISLLLTNVQLEVQAGNWKCCFCQYANVEEMSSGKINLQGSPEMTATAVDYVLPNSVGNEQRSISKRQAIVFVIDLTFGSAMLHILQKSIEKTIEQLDDDVEVGLVFVDRCVSICNLKSKTGLLDLHCIPGQTINIPTSLRRPPLGFHSCLCPLRTCREAINIALTSMKTSSPQMPEMLRPRCQGTAIHEALVLINETHISESSSNRRERVIVMTCGPPNVGSGSVPPELKDVSRFQQAKLESQEYFDRLADVASKMGVVIDVYGISNASVGLSLIERLAKYTSGVVSLQSVIWPSLFATQIVESMRHSFGTNGLFDIRLSRGLRLSHMMGHLHEKLSNPPSQKWKMTTNACLLKSMHVGKTLNLFFEATSDFHGDELYVQFWLSWQDRKDGSQVERIVTYALSPTGNLREFLKSVHAPTAAVLLGKKLVLECTEFMKKREKKKLDDARNGLAFQCSFMVQKFGKLLESKERGYFGLRTEKKWGCPQELWYVVQCLYHLHKSPLLGELEPHSDETVYLQNAFLTTTLESANRTIVPKLFSIDSELKWTEVPPITTSLTSKHVMLLDHGLHIFVWIGKEVSTEDAKWYTILRNCEEFAIQKCHARGIMSELVVVREQENSSFYARLVPSHRDTKEDQEAQMGSLNKNEERTIKEVQNEPLSLYEWCRCVSIEPPILEKGTLTTVSAVESVHVLST